MFATSKATLAALASLGRWVRPSRGRVAGTVALMLVGGSLEGATVGLLVPLLAMLTGSKGESSPVEARLDFLLGGFSTEMKVLVLGIALIVVVAAKNAISFAGVYSAGMLRSRAMIELRRQLLGTLLHAPPALLERQTSGEIANVFVAEATRINRVLDLCVSLVMRTIVATSYLVALVVLSWQLTAVTAVLAVVLGAVSSWLGARALRIGRQFTAANSALSRHITELVGGLRVVRTTATEAVREESFERPNRTHAEADVGASMSQALQTGTTETLAIAGAMGLTALAYKVWFGAGAMTAATFLAFGFGLIRLLPALTQIYMGQGFLTPLVGSVEHVVRWLELPRYPERPFGTASVPHLEKGIRFENLSFAYSDGHEAVRSLSFFLPAGATLAVLGPSGSGKSTFAALLLRLREPSRGTIELDGTDYWTFSRESYHRAVAFVEQEPFLFNASVFENVTCGAPSIGREAVQKALEIAQLSDVVARLPQGIDTVLAERGSTLSGGQRQRLAIARAIVRDPELLVLDEPTSALDPDTEREVVRAISAAARGRTTILIAHRVSTVEHAQYVLRFADGRATIDSKDASGAPLKKAADAS